MSRRLKILIIFIIIVVAGYALTFLSRGTGPAVPTSFFDARTQGAAIAVGIVTTSNQSTSDLAKINELDNEGRYGEALTLTTSLIAQSDSLRSQAVDLSNQVGNMTKSLSGVKSVDARQAALDSISSRLALINELITYSDDLNKLLATLQNHFTGKAWQPHDVATLVDQINTEISAINNFNQQATQSMQKFDSITSR